MGAENQKENLGRQKTAAEIKAEEAAEKQKIADEAKKKVDELKFDMSLSGIFAGAFEGIDDFFESTGQVIKGFWEYIFEKPSTGLIEAPSSSAQQSADKRVSVKTPTNEKKETFHGQFKQDLTKLMGEFGIVDTGNDKHNFVLVAVELGKEVQAKYGVPWQAVVAQACLESGLGASGLSQKNFNCFGIKAQKGYTGQFANWNTAEFFNGQREVINSSFRAYGSIRDSFMDYGRFLTENKRYAKAFQYAASPLDFLSTVIKSGYATDPNYVAKAQSVAGKYGIDLA